MLIHWALNLKTPSTKTRKTYLQLKIIIQRETAAKQDMNLY